MKMNIENEKREQAFTPLACTELLRRFEEKEVLPMGEELSFSGVEGKDVYNITAPYLIGDKTVIAGRVEERDATAKSLIMFFEEKDGVWSPIEGGPTFPLEDGFLTQINGETIFGGVEVYPKNLKDKPDEVGYRTVFYRGQDIFSLKKFAVGPDMMKDIRIVDLKNGKIGVFTRPQGGNYAEGKIGYVEITNLDELNDAEKLLGARIIENQFAPGEWGGVNDPRLLPNGEIDAVGHIAYHDEQDKKHYYAMEFNYNPKTHSASPIEIIATRKNFPAGEAKTNKHEDIVYPTNSVPHEDGSSTLYVGYGDTKAGRLERPYPFTKKAA